VFEIASGYSVFVTQSSPYICAGLCTGSISTNDRLHGT